MTDSFQISEGVMQVAARLDAALGVGNRVVVVTSYDENDGASDLAAQIAVAFARLSQAPVALVDGNRAAPVMDRIFGVSNSPGFGEIIEEAADAGTATHATGSGVSVIPAGSAQPVVAAPAVARLFEKLRGENKYVVVAAGPLLYSADAVTLCSQSDGAVLTLRSGKRHVPEVRELQRELSRLKVELLGAVVRGQK